MRWRSSGNFSRSFINAARTPTIRPSTTFCRPLSSNSLQHSRRLNQPRILGSLGCLQSLMPMHSVVADARLTSHIVVDARACCELSQDFWIWLLKKKKHLTVELVLKHLDLKESSEGLLGDGSPNVMTIEEITQP